MNLLTQAWINQKRTRLMRARVLFYALLALGLAGYAFAFSGDSVLPPMLTGVGVCVVLVLVYYALLFPNKKAVKLADLVACGLTQEETYTFLSFDGETERDGVPLTRVNVRYKSEEETYERTLYAIADTPLPVWEAGHVFVGKTYQNILVDVKDHE